MFSIRGFYFYDCKCMDKKPKFWHSPATTVARFARLILT